METAMPNEPDVGETLFAIEVEATAVSASGYRRCDTHAMLAFTEAREVDDAYAAIDDALTGAGWSNISFGRVKDITGVISCISDDKVREHAEAAYTHVVSLLIYSQPCSTST